MMHAWRSGMVLLILAGSASARQRASHIPIPPTNDHLSPGQLLNQKLGDAKTNQLLHDLLRGAGRNDRNLHERLLQSDLAVDILRRLGAGDPELMKLVEQMKASYPELQHLSPSDFRDHVSSLARQYSSGARWSQRTQGEFGPRPPISLDDRERNARQIYKEQINDLLRDWKLEGVAEQLRDSPAFRELIQEMARSELGSIGFSNQLNFNQLNLKSIGNWVSNLRARLPKNLPNIRGPSMPNQIPNISLGRPSLPGRFESPSFGEGWSAIICVFMVGLSFALLWKVIRWTPQHNVGLNKFKRRKLDLDHVNSWPDLIRAFEGIALNQFGQEALHWNHRRLAASLATSSLSNDVDSVSALYEQGRYAPNLGSPPSWEPIRAALRRLAGGPA